MSGIEWTEEQPTEEGWYWVKLKNANWINDKCETVAYIRKSAFYDGIVMFLCGYEYDKGLSAATHFSRIEQ
jgi:hypothetical protein